MPGCWDRTELNEIGIASATAVDWQDDHWIVSYQLVIPQSISNQNAGGGSVQQAPVMVFSTNGTSIQEADQKSSLEMPRSLFFAHNRIIVIGEEAARHGISEVVESYLRNADSRETVSVFVTKQRGRSILEQIVPLEKIPGAALKNMQKNQDKQGSDLKQVMMYQLAMGITSDSGYTTIPEVILSGSGEAPTSVEILKNTYVESKLKMNRLGVFKKDKLIGWLSSHESYGINWITNRIKHTIMYFGCTRGSNNFKAAARIYKAKTHLNLVQQNGLWVAKVDVQADAQLIENNCGIDASKPEGLAQMEALMSFELSDLMQNSLDAAKGLNADVLGFGEYIHKKDPKTWGQLKDNWQEAFMQIKLEPSVHIHLKRLGMSNKPFADLISPSHD
ncbi:Ger(x)C family spore germination protein [Paenibacillus hexagrammi]|uniref:Ger(X)C family spore germination protein n=1 Tax=Paenibacillus hexagrammi TaxID=2908839 RepID=A0ABY3SK05_9BACL|nr:Ger(x)C family spore germination protein [Paenibacillus sp. YPD9-1]UJF34379.1 Ger(x)C family spore germination protein [Paenibacillus sp. YPD9-1]